MTEIMILAARDFVLRATETIREFVEGNHMFLRVTVVGPYFPQRDSAPFVRIVGARANVESLMAEISADQKELRGYFPTDTPLAGHVEFGYASQVMGRITMTKLKVSRLDAGRVEPKVHRVTRRDPGPFTRQR